MQALMHLKNSVGGYLAMAAISIVMLSSAFQAQAASYMDTPLMIVRFNQTRVYYQQPLYNAVAQALQAKPTAVFNIITYVPVTGRKQADSKLNAKAQQHAQTLVGDMVKMGVPQTRLRVSYRNDPALTSDEVHIYVE